MGPSGRAGNRPGAARGAAHGAADGSARAVDPAVAGAMLHAAINVASDMRILTISRESDIVGRFVHALFGGLSRP